MPRTRRPWYRPHLPPTLVNPTPDDTLHFADPAPILWSRGNFGEALPGVVTPLSWSFWRPGTDRTAREMMWRRFGVLSEREARAPITGPEQVVGALIHGRYVANVDFICGIVARVPGGNPAALELQILGVEREHPDRPTDRSRWPVVLARLPVSAALTQRRLDRIRRDTHLWWTTKRRPGALDGPTVALQTFDEARERFCAIAIEHGFCGLMGQAVYDLLLRVCRLAGRPDLVVALAASGQGTEETELTADLWRASRGELPLAEVVARHGFHGPDEGELSARSWCDDPSPLEAQLERYRVIGAPLVRDRSVRRTAEAELFASLRPSQRPLARLALRSCDHFIPLREVGKVALLQAIDVGRAAARAYGRHLVAIGALEEPDDVFFLTRAELEGDRATMRTVVAERHAARAELERIELPKWFVGQPEVLVPSAANGSALRPGDTLDALGVSPGVVEAVARVVLSADDADHLEPGDVLVCPVTDPGWVVLFELAGAVVVDIGGELSHAAIVAREMGLPCVVSTGDGSKRIPDGARVRVDGTTGRVEVLQASR